MGDKVGDLSPALGILLEHLLRLGRRNQAQIVHFVLPHAESFEEVLDLRLVPPLAVATLTLDQLVAVDLLAGEQPALNFSAHRLAPILHQRDLGHGDRQVVVAGIAVNDLGQELGELINGAGSVTAHNVSHVGTQGTAGGLCLAEAALLFARLKELGQILLVRLLCLAAQFRTATDVIARAQQIRDRDVVLADEVQAGHVNVHADGIEVAQNVVLMQRAKCVYHELRIFLGLDANAHAVLQVDHGQVAPCRVHDHNVAGAAGTNLSRQVADGQPALDKKHLTLRQLADEVDVIVNVVGHVLRDAPIHHFAVIIELDNLVRVILCVQFLFHKYQGRQLVRGSALAGVTAARVWVCCLKDDAAGAAQPTVRPRG